MERTLKGTQRKDNMPLFFFCFVVILHTKKQQKRASSFLTVQGATVGHHFQSIDSGRQSCWSHLNTKRTSNPMNSTCRLPSACTSVVGPRLCVLPVHFPPWAQTKTWSLYPPNTEQIRRLTLQTVAGPPPRKGVFLKLQLPDARRRK